MIKKCSTCKGTGVLPQYNHIHNGRCFQCNGSGKVEVTGNSKRLEALQEAFTRIENNYLQSKKQLDRAIKEFSEGLITPFELADVCGELNFKKVEKDYLEWIAVIESEKELLADN